MNTIGRIRIPLINDKTNNLPFAKAINKFQKISEFSKYINRRKNLCKTNP